MKSYLCMLALLLPTAAFADEAEDRRVGECNEVEVTCERVCLNLEGEREEAETLACFAGCEERARSCRGATQSP